MLVNLTPDLKEIERRRKISEEYKIEYTPQSDSKWLQETGIYQSSFPFNFPTEEFIELQNLSYDDEYKIFENYYKPTYGVADSIVQIKEFYKDEVEDPNTKYAFALTPVYQDKSNKGKGDGWRWHKWGAYIGKLNPQCEYLDDEEFGSDFKYVIVFQIYKIKSNE